MVLLPKLTISSPHGAFWSTDDYGGITEADLLTCAHCQYTWRVVPGSGRRRGWCRRCNGPLCGKPKCMAGCLPIAEQIEIYDRLHQHD